MRIICFNPLNTELNLICHLLALLEAHHILHVSGIRVNGPLYECLITGIHILCILICRIMLTARLRLWSISQPSGSAIWNLYTEIHH